MKARVTLFLAAVLLLAACNGIESLPVSETETVAQSSSSSSVEILPLDQVLPLDTAVRTGTLENGLTYYIRENTEPENRAELWLAINAGSLQEDEDQLGLAHFLEHMLFNGTERFPQMGVVDFLESIGMEFGPDVNAYTSFDETVYTIQVPTDDAEVLATGLDVLEDWASAATLDPAEIDKERGVIVEEHRLDQETASGRISDQTLPAVLGDSRYTERRPIGDMDVVGNAPPEAFERFYDDWYRPDLMAVIAVGDFDADDVEAMIQDRFSDLANPADAPERQLYEVPTVAGTDYHVITDPEETLTEIQIWQRQREKPLHTGEDYRDLLVRGLYYSVLNERLLDIQRQPDASFLSAWAGQGEYVRPLHVDVSFVQVEDDGVAAGLEAALTEFERMARYSVTEGELNRAKEEWLTSYEDALQERDNNDSSNHADEYLEYFLSGTAAPGINYEHQLVADVLPTITVDEVSAIADNLVSPDDRIVIVTAPEKEEITLPDGDELAAVVEATTAMEIDPFTEESVAETLLDEIPEPVGIVAQQYLAESDITEFELANGVRVLIKPTDFMDDEILFTGFSLGGSSLVSDEDYPEAATIVNIVGESGVGDFDQSSLEKVLTGKSVAIAPYIRELTEGIEGSSSVDDVETLFQLIYLYLTQPRAEEDAFEVFKKQMIASLENQALDPNVAFGDAVDQALFGDSIRYNTLPIEVIESLDLDRGMEIYQERFADLDDAVFVFVGNVDNEQIAALAQRYLGNLPATDRTESWQDVMPDPPQGIVESNVYKGEGDRSIAQLLFVNPYEGTLEEDLSSEAAEMVLDILVREELRENLGGVYASGVGGFARKLPDPVYTGYVYFGAEPDRVDELLDASFAQIEALQTEGPSAENLNKAKSIALSQHEENLEQNGYWRSVIKDAEIYDDKSVDDVYAMAELIEAITAEDVQLAAQSYFDLDQYVKVVLLPESYE